jgi:hypothetical protein
MNDADNPSSASPTRRQREERLAAEQDRRRLRRLRLDRGSNQPPPDDAVAEAELGELRATVARALEPLQITSPELRDLAIELVAAGHAYRLGHDPLHCKLWQDRAYQRFADTLPFLCGLDIHGPQTAVNRALQDAADGSPQAFKNLFTPPPKIGPGRRTTSGAAQERALIRTWGTLLRLGNTVFTTDADAAAEVSAALRAAGIHRTDRTVLEIIGGEPPDHPDANALYNQAVAAFRRRGVAEWDRPVPRRQLVLQGDAAC